MKTLSTAMLSVGLTTLLAACGTIVEVDGVRMRCDDRDVSVVNVAGRLQVKKERVEVCPGYSVNLIFRNPVAMRAARTRQTGAGANWLDVDNGSTNRIVITPPAETPRGEYKYSLEVDNIGLLDPRIVVQ
jgi:hypothetical protein